ncbi:unnamed protein product [Amoebophrya sp. A120]|nr:unnamed protein product [Amoebophrya sp. A120]|eukprot:GSA120T00019804001.1
MNVWLWPEVEARCAPSIKKKRLVFLVRMSDGCMAISEIGQAYRAKGQREGMPMHVSYSFFYRDGLRTSSFFPSGRDPVRSERQAEEDGAFKGVSAQQLFE